MKTFYALATGIFLSATLCAQTSYKFDFSSGRPETGWIRISPTNLYSDATGYGFEPGALPVAVGQDALGADQPFYFSIKEPEGNYQVTVTFGSAAAPSDNTVKAELRRLMLEKIHTDAGQSVTRSFVVNVRIPEFPGGKVRLKMPFNHDKADSAIRKVEIEKVDVPTIYILGDSTVCDQSTPPWNSWGQMITRWFGPGVAIANHAESGETLASSIGEKRFAKVYSLLKPGDYVLMQFGHNDMKSKAADALETYKADYVKVIAEIRHAGDHRLDGTFQRREQGHTHGLPRRRPGNRRRAKGCVH
jgi:hypothetical protein